MSSAPYADLLPAQRRADVRPEPAGTWWRWRDHELHLLRVDAPAAPVRLLVVHGAGGHAGALWPLASLVPDDVAEVTAVDLPLYGRTRTHDAGSVRYGDWVEALVHLVREMDDGRPLVVLGASMGGLLAVEVAARDTRVAAVVATCLLDPRTPGARAVMTRFGRLGVLVGPASGLVRGPLSRARVAISWVTALSGMSLNPALSRLCATDPRGGGVRVPLGFLTSYLTFRHSDPTGVRTPVTLAHPARDGWTPVRLSRVVLERFAGPIELRLLRNAGHFPVEEPGVGDLMDVLGEVCRGVRSC